METIKEVLEDLYDGRADYHEAVGELEAHYGHVMQDTRLACIGAVQKYAKLHGDEADTCVEIIGRLKELVLDPCS